MTIDVEKEMKVYAHETFKFKEPFLTLKTNKKFLGKGQNCSVTELSGARDNPDFDCKTILVENNEKVYVFISGFEIINIAKIMDIISKMGYIMMPYPLAFGEKITYFLSDHYKFIKSEKVEEGNLL